MRRLIGPFLVAIVSAVASVAALGAFPVTVIDDRGLGVSIQETPMRIVAVGALYAQVLVDLGLLDRLVAVAETDDNPPEVADLPSVGLVFAPSVEVILGHAPDLVLGPTDWGGERPALEGAGVTVLSTPLLISVVSVLDMVRTIGAAVGADREAALLVGRIAADVIEVEASALGLEPVSAAFLYATSREDPPYTAGAGSIEHELILRAGGSNVFADAGPFPQVSFEEIIARDPAVIFTAPSQIENILENPFLQSVQAVAEERVYGIRASLVSSTRIADALRLIIEGLHGEGP